MLRKVPEVTQLGSRAEVFDSIAEQVPGLMGSSWCIRVTMAPLLD